MVYMKICFTFMLCSILLLAVSAITDKDGPLYAALVSVSVAAVSIIIGIWACL